MKSTVYFREQDNGHWWVRWKDPHTVRWHRATFDTEAEATAYGINRQEHQNQVVQQVKDLEADLDSMLSRALGPDRLEHGQFVTRDDPRSRIGQLYRRCDEDSQRFLSAALYGNNPR